MNRITATLLCLMLCLAGTSLHATAFAAEQTSVSAPSAPSPATPAQVVALKTPVAPPPSIRPFPVPVTTRTVTVPASIDATGTIDVYLALQNLIEGVPDGTLINFPSTGIYRIDHAIVFENRHNLIIDGNGCTLKYTSVTGTEQGYSFWYNYESASDNGSDIWIRNFVLIGSSTNPGVYTPGDSPRGGEQQHGVVVESDRFEVSGCTISAVWGDGFYVASGATGVWIHDNHVISAGRNGLSVISATNVVAERNAFDTCGLVTFDVEPNNGSEPSNNIMFLNNTAGTYGNGRYFFNAVDGPGAIIDRIVVNGNTVTGGSLSAYVDSGGAVRMTRITFTNNMGKVTAADPLLYFKHIDGLTVTGNIQPLTSSGPMQITDCAEVVTS